ncbi:hypothetical protein [Acidihalobacter prosperus]
MRLGVGLWLALVAACLLLAGLLVLAWGIERLLFEYLGPIPSLLLTGAGLVIIAGGVGWVAARRIR